MTGSKKATAPRARDWLVAAATGLGYFIAAYSSLYMAQSLDGIATIWPASGVFIAALLLSPRRRLPAIIIAVALASYLSNFLFGASSWAAAVFTFANILEALVVNALVRRFGGSVRLFDRLGTILRFAGAVLAGGLTSAGIATLLVGGASLGFFVSWFTTVCLGTLVVAPLIIAASRYLAEPERQFRQSNKTGFVVLTAMISAASLAIFVLDADQLLFVPVIAVVVAAYLYGASGAAISIALIAAIAMFGTDFSGSTDDFFGMDGDTLLLQLYLLGLLVAAWPLTALIAEKERLLAEYVDTNRYLELAEKTAHIGHWYLPANEGKLMWSAEVYRIHGIGETEMLDAHQRSLEDPDSLSLYHPDDRARIREVLQKAMEKGTGFAYKARILRPDGEMRHVSCLGRPSFYSTGHLEGLFGTFQDVTDQAETLAALQIARNDALREAASAQRLSETDDLTGIANRRKIITQLHAANRRTRRTDSAISLAILDIDHFKSINDTHGHQAGDRVIQRVAALLSEESRSSDHAGRIGGEEFLVVLPGADAAEAFAIVERLRSRIAEETWPDGPQQVTVSAGLVTIDGGGDVDSALRRADEALYQAKNEGRNALRSAA